MTMFIQNIELMESAYMMSQPIVFKTGTLHNKLLQKD